MNPVEYARMYEVEDSHWWYVGLHELILAIVKRESMSLGRALRIFDAGCGTGRLCELLAQFGQVDGCDNSEEAISFCRGRGVATVKVLDLNHISLEQDTYDAITSIDVLYHNGIAHDISVLKSLNAALKPDGLLILQLPAFNFLRGTHDVAVYTRERYTIDKIKERLAASGFAVEYSTYRLCFLFPAIACYRKLCTVFKMQEHDSLQVDSDLKQTPQLINKLLLALVRVENRLLNRISLPLGSSAFVLARKKQGSVFAIHVKD